MADMSRNDQIIEKCKAKGEPYFVLRAQDVLAADIVYQYASRVQSSGLPSEFVAACFEIASAFQDWPNKKIPD